MQYLTRAGVLGCRLRAELGGTTGRLKGDTGLLERGELVTEAGRKKLGGWRGVKMRKLVGIIAYEI